MILCSLNVQFILEGIAHSDVNIRNENTDSDRINECNKDAVIRK